jgi:hypothetical protein
MRNRRREGARREGDVLKGLLAGVAGGLAAAWVMNQFQAKWGELAEGVDRPHGAQSLQQGSPAHGVGRELREEGSDEQQDDATERVANAISTGVFGHELTRSEKRRAGAAVHYAFGLTTGAAYGALAEVLPAVTTGAGLPFGTVVWAAADEGLVPALGLSKSPAEYPPSIHAYALASHLVFGLTAEMVRRGVRSVI